MNKEYTSRNLLLFVCTGNTCRSPMAAAIFNHFSEKMQSNWFAMSAGIATESGLPVSVETKEALREQNIYLEDHSSHQLEERMLKDVHFVLTMTRTQRDLLHIYFPEYKAKIKTLAEIAGLEEDIADPFGGDLDEYRRIAKIFMEIMPVVVKKLTEQQEM